MTPMKVVTVEVVVLEAGHVVARKGIGYFEGQPYQVQVVTPDGIDWSMPEQRVGQGEVVTEVIEGEAVEVYEMEPVSRSAVVALLEQITPFLVVKRRQADLVLQFLRSRGRPAMRGWFRPYNEYEWRLYHELREANRRGPR